MKRNREFMMSYVATEAIAQVTDGTIDRNVTLFPSYFDTPDSILHQIHLSLQAELESPGLWSWLVIDSLRTILSVALLQKSVDQQEAIVDNSIGLSSHNLKQAVDYIDAHLSEKIVLQDIATEVKLSVCYFATLFKQSAGLTVNQYIAQRRISKAKQLLKQPNLKIIEVAQAVGFLSQSHFNLVFRRWTGTTPTAYRKKTNESF
jgi:AraC family transcriptional regulator